MKTCRLLRLPEVIEITGSGRDTIYRTFVMADFRRSGESANASVRSAKMRSEHGSIRDRQSSLQGRRNRQFKLGYAAHHRVEFFYHICAQSLCAALPLTILQGAG
jgi:hypothetical protein